LCKNRREDLQILIKTGGTLNRVKNTALNTQLNGAGSNVPFIIVEYQFSDNEDKIKFSDIQKFNNFFEGF